ncbi:3103_t:CDS:1, partial [Ambispora gerdemannii]
SSSGISIIPSDPAEAFSLFGVDANDINGTGDGERDGIKNGDDIRGVGIEFGVGIKFRG